MNIAHWWKKERAIRAADCWIKKGNLDNALIQIENAIKDCPGNVDLLIQKTWMLLDLKQFKKAMDAVQEGIALKPNHGIFHMLHGEILYAAAQYEEAKKALHHALEISGDNLRIEYHLGLVYVALGDMSKAAQYFESSIRYDKSLVQSRLLAMAERYMFEQKTKQ